MSLASELKSDRAGAELTYKLVFPPGCRTDKVDAMVTSGSSLDDTAIPLHTKCST